ncbi:hypothetical protein [Hydrocarboniphaga sp.]|uniref:hypothetical protein n=1 Tax=Hydrocarboniphaga sp. TaxID=2033016 RepID=UPI003D09A48B
MYATASSSSTLSTHPVEPRRPADQATAEFEATAAQDQPLQRAQQRLILRQPS